MIAISKGEESPQKGYIIDKTEKLFLEIGKDFVSEYLQARGKIAEKYLKEHECEGCGASCQ